MAVNESIVTRYGQAASEIRYREEKVAEIITTTFDQAREKKLLEDIGMPEEQISNLRATVDEFKTDGTSSILINRCTISELQLEMYKDICRQIDELKSMIAK